MAQRQFSSSDTSLWLDRYGDGSDGALTISGNTTDAPIDSACTGTSGTTSLSATNASFAAGQLLLIHQSQGTGAGNWELNKIQSYSSGTITTAYPLINTYVSAAQVLVLKQYSAITINGLVTLTTKAWDGTVGGISGFLCNGTTIFSGTAKATVKGFREGPRETDPPSYAIQGEGTVGAGAQNTQTANGNGGGCGISGGDYAGAGGGNGAAGSNSGVATGGSAAGNASLTSMVFGGGGGGATVSGGLASLGVSGPGGGNILIISKSFTVTGSAVSGGGDGSVQGSQASGGSGGAGGSILVKGQTIVLGSNLVTAPAGIHSAHGSAGGQDGVDGAVGRIYCFYSDSLSGTTTPTLGSAVDPILSDAVPIDIDVTSSFIQGVKIVG